MLKLSCRPEFKGTYHMWCGDTDVVRRYRCGAEAKMWRGDTDVVWRYRCGAEAKMWRGDKSGDKK